MKRRHFIVASGFSALAVSESSTALVSPSANRPRIQSKNLWASFYGELSYQ